MEDPRAPSSIPWDRRSLVALVVLWGILVSLVPSLFYFSYGGSEWWSTRSSDRGRCHSGPFDQGCWDGRFKGNFPATGYKAIYFNMNIHTALLLLLCFLYGWAAHTGLTQIWLNMREKTLWYGAAVCIAAQAYANFYSFWMLFNYINDVSYALLDNQLFFAVTDLFLYYQCVWLLDRRRLSQRSRRVAGACVAILHLLLLLWDQLDAGYLFWGSELRQRLRDAPLMLSEGIVLAVLVPGLRPIQLRDLARPLGLVLVIAAIARSVKVLSKMEGQSPALKHVKQSEGEEEAVAVAPTIDLSRLLTKEALAAGLPGPQPQSWGNAKEEREWRNKVWAQTFLSVQLGVDSWPRYELTRAEMMGELKRIEEARRLAQWLEKECQKRRLRGSPKDAFTRWCFTCKMLERSSGIAIEPLLPLEGDVDAGLQDELMKAKLSLDDAAQVCKDLATQSRQSVRTISEIRQKEGSSGSKMEDIPIIKETDSYSVTFNGSTFRVNIETFDRLKKRYRAKPELMGAHLWRLLGRYEALSGEGYQGQLRKEVLKHLYNKHHVQHECFASPLNAYLPNYTSAFPDTDESWSSHGSFFHYYGKWKKSPKRDEGGCFEINPPFLEEIMLATVLYVDIWLQEVAPLTFFIFFPGWSDTPAYEVLKASRFTKFIKLIPKREHSYVAGHSHKPRRTNTHFAYADTYFFVCQNDAGAKKHPVREADVAEILKLMQGHGKR